MGVGVGHRVGEPELKLCATQVRLAVVLDEGIDAGEREVVSQEVLHGPTLHGGTDPAVLDPAGPPGGRGTTLAPRLGPLALPAPGVVENMQGGRGTWRGENCSQGHGRVGTMSGHTGLPLLLEQAWDLAQDGPLAWNPEHSTYFLHLRLPT